MNGGEEVEDFCKELRELESLKESCGERGRGGFEF